MNKVVDAGFKKAFKGNWGSQTHTKRIGVVQDLNRLSHNTMLSHLRKTNLHLDAGVKLVGPRVLHASQWGFFDPIDTPDGGNIGLHKHLSISAYITKGISREPMIKWMRDKVKLKFVEECSPIIISQNTKVFVNGYWAGMVEDPFQCVNYIKLFRRNGLLPIYISVSFDIKQNTIFVYTDEGRVDLGPFFTKIWRTVENSFLKKRIARLKNGLQRNDFTWDQLISGFNEKKKDAKFHPKNMKIYELYDLYEGSE
jgi:DNA-directed RNA polymerase II subunit RPB2